MGATVTIVRPLRLVRVVLLMAAAVGALAALRALLDRPVGGVDSWPPVPRKPTATE